MALLGQDQDASVQKTMLSVLRRVAVASPAALQPHWKDLVPSVCAIVQGSAGPTKVAAERTLARVMSLDKGIEPALAWVPSGGPLARTIMQARLHGVGATVVVWGRHGLGARATAAAGSLGAPRSTRPAVCRLPAAPAPQEAFLRRLSKMPVEEEDDGLL